MQRHAWAQNTRFMLSQRTVLATNSVRELSSQSLSPSTSSSSDFWSLRVPALISAGLLGIVFLLIGILFFCCRRKHLPKQHGGYTNVWNVDQQFEDSDLETVESFSPSLHSRSRSPSYGSTHSVASSKKLEGRDILEI